MEASKSGSNRRSQSSGRCERGWREQPLCGKRHPNDACRPRKQAGATARHTTYNLHLHARRMIVRITTNHHHYHQQPLLPFFHSKNVAQNSSRITPTTPPPAARLPISDSRITSIRFALRARNVSLVSGNPTCSVPALQGCEGLWPYNYSHS